MVPKRQIQLKRKKDDKNIEKPQVKLEDSLAEGGGANNKPRHGPDLLRRQHSLPASLHTTSSGLDSYRVYRGRVAGAKQGFSADGPSRQRLQKSFSLDETKTKMATCIIQSILSKKMQVERNSCQTATQQRKPSAPPSVEQRGGRNGVGGQTGGGVSKAPIHVVRDMRKLVKETSSLDFTTPDNSKPTSFKGKGQEESPPPTYQQAVGVKGHSQASVYSVTCRGHVAKVAASLSQSQNRNKREEVSHPITQQRQGSEPVVSWSKANDVIMSGSPLGSPTLKLNPPVSSDLTQLSQSERGRGKSHRTEASSSPPVSLHHGPPSTLLHLKGPQPSPSTLLHPQAPQPPPSSLLHIQGHRPPPSTLEQSSTLGLSSQFVPRSSQQILQPCFYPAPVLPMYPPILHPHVGKVSYLNSPLNFIQTPLQPTLPASTHHTLRRLQESSTPENTSDHHDHFGPQEQSSDVSDVQMREGSKVTSTEHEQRRQEQQEQQQLQQQHLCSLQGLLPAQVGGDFIVDITGSAAPGAVLSGPVPCHFMFDPRSGRCFYMDTPTTPQRKMLLDPETGQYVCVLLPAQNSAPNSSLLSTNHTPIIINPAHPLYNPAPSIVSMMQLQPTVAVSSLYPCARPPFSQHTPSANATHNTP